MDNNNFVLDPAQAVPAAPVITAIPEAPTTVVDPSLNPAPQAKPISDLNSQTLPDITSEGTTALPTQDKINLEQNTDPSAQNLTIGSFGNASSPTPNAELPKPNPPAVPNPVQTPTAFPVPAPAVMGEMPTTNSQPAPAAPPSPVAFSPVVMAPSAPINVPMPNPSPNPVPNPAPKTSTDLIGFTSAPPVAFASPNSQTAPQTASMGFSVDALRASMEKDGPVDLTQSQPLNTMSTAAANPVPNNPAPAIISDTDIQAVKNEDPAKEKEALQVLIESNRIDPELRDHLKIELLKLSGLRDAKTVEGSWAFNPPTNSTIPMPPMPEPPAPPVLPIQAVPPEEPR